MRGFRRFFAACVFPVLFLLSCQNGPSGLPGDPGAVSPDLTYTHSMELRYAEKFTVDYYEGGYGLLTVDGDKRFLVVPGGQPVPGDLEKDIVILRQPVENIYLAASAVMDMFVSIDALDHIRFSSIKPDGWYIPEAREAMAVGRILYAGSYSAPDYEKILERGCALAVENTMIYHTPEVKEQLERLGIPVLVDYSSYESEPMGRTEWVKCYGLLTGREEEAEKIFEDQARKFETVKEAASDKKGERKTVAFFYFTANGGVNVRKSSDYLARMIEMAGGAYVFGGTREEESASSTMTLQMEEFYKTAREADYLIYNSTVDRELTSVKELVEKQELLTKFKAVQEGNVFCTRKKYLSVLHGTGDDHG